MTAEFAAFQDSLDVLAQVALRTKGPQSVTRPRLDRIAAAMQAIRTAATEAAGEDGYAHLVERLAELEVRLKDSKIADRVRGYLEDQTDADPTEAIVRHVDAVLRPTRTRILLEQALSELEEELEERRLVAQAKGILQARDLVSEGQAHSELRLRSRRLRKPLKDVARQVITTGDHDR